MVEDSEQQPTVLVTRDEPHVAHTVARWGLCIARGTGARLISAPPFASACEVLGVAIKREVDWLVTGLRSRRQLGQRVAAFDEDLALTLRRAPCPVVTVQPWADAPPSSAGIAVAGVDRSPESYAAAHAAARLLVSALPAPPRLILVHGCEVHPAELAAKTPWPRLVDAMRPERHEWVLALADELRGKGLGVEIIVKLAWAPDLIAGVARREDADFTAVGVAARVEGQECRLSQLHQHLLRGTPCPMLTANAGESSEAPALA